ncbi:hypothetical protein PanWU01x14_303260 [Parasponia andersonii]|uniref:Uncharacterized protein n=1 Tax=Parasponia andersonii TaxID=3476 RepID=A0A2P5AT15_PARAD|nr:hypothetical protein PanWU01x14_303260 [Parasponia andersonii]
MAYLVSRKARIYNDCPEPVLLKVLEYPGPSQQEAIPIPPGGHQDISYQTVNNPYNRACRREVHIWRNEQEKPEKEHITSWDVRDCEKLKLTLINDDDEENKKKVHVHRIEANYFLRIRYCISIYFISFFLSC